MPEALGNANLQRRWLLCLDSPLSAIQKPGEHWGDYNFFLSQVSFFSLRDTLTKKLNFTTIIYKSTRLLKSNNSKNFYINNHIFDFVLYS